MNLRDAIQMLQSFSTSNDKRRHFLLEGVQKTIEQIDVALRLIPPAAAQLKQIAIPALDAATRNWITNAAEIMPYFYDVTAYRQAMIRHGWPPLFHVDENQLKKLVAIINDDSMAGSEITMQLESCILEWHSNEVLDELLNAWSKHPLLSDSIAAILGDAVHAHQQGKFTLSVPAILPQIEGLIARGYGHQGHMSGKTLKTYFEQLLSLSIHDNIAKHFLNDKYLAGFEHGNKIDIPLSRHAVLHGGDVEYATAAVSLRAILFFDYLLAQMSFVASKTEQTLHISRGCAAADDITGDQRIFFAVASHGDSSSYNNCPECFMT